MQIQSHLKVENNIVNRSDMFFNIMYLMLHYINIMYVISHYLLLILE